MLMAKKIAENIELRRKKLGLSVEKLSRLADISLSALNKIRNCDTNNMRIETFYSISKALNCAMDDLVK